MKIGLVHVEAPFITQIAGFVRINFVGTIDIHGRELPLQHITEPLKLRY
jgi:hypothetical protein